MRKHIHSSVLQYLPEFPVFWTIHFHHTPKSRTMVAFPQVREFVNHHIVEHTQGEMDQPPIEENGILRRTTPPTAPCIGEFDPII